MLLFATILFARWNGMDPGVFLCCIVLGPGGEEHSTQALKSNQPPVATIARVAIRLRCVSIGPRMCISFHANPSIHPSISRGLNKTIVSNDASRVHSCSLYISSHRASLASFDDRKNASRDSTSLLAFFYKQRAGIIHRSINKLFRLARGVLIILVWRLREIDQSCART